MAPKGKVKLLTLFETPALCSTHSSVKGKVAEDELVGNMNTRTVLEEIQKHSTSTIKLDIEAFKDAEQYAAKEVFGKYK